jgi:nicotinamidase-related amidase
MAADAYTASDLTRAALVTIDVQRDVLDGGALEVPGSSAVLPRITGLVEAFRRVARPIVHAVRLYLPDASNVDLCRRTAVQAGAGALLAGTPGSQLAQDLLPDASVELDVEALLGGSFQRLGPEEDVMYKPRWGAFYGTGLEDALRRREVHTLVFAGCNFPNCPRTSIYEASERDFRIVLARDAVSGVYERGERELEGIGVSIISAGEVCEQLDARVAPA